MSRRLTRILVSAVSGGVLTALLAKGINTPGKHWYNLVAIPPLLVSTAFSGNPHQGNEVVFWAASYVMLFGVTYLLLALVSRVLSKAGPHAER